VRKPSFFPPKLSKNAGNIVNILCVEGGLVSPKRARKTACAALCGFFLSKKSAPAKRKKGSYTRRLPKNKKIKGIFE
jgi:hypothetical protein